VARHLPIDEMILGFLIGLAIWAFVLLPLIYRSSQLG
jgi:hypothetical protein